MSVELLAPAGNLVKGYIALLFGADAIYIGGKEFSLRSGADNFSISDIKKIVNFAHKLNKKVYLTINSFVHEKDLKLLRKYIAKVKLLNIDAVIASNIGVIELLKEASIPVHLSTQMSVINSSAIKYFVDLGVERVVLGREVTLDELKLIRQNTNIQLEIFIHGGMCSSYSGRCTLANVMTNRDANRGGCSHSCRWEYLLYNKDKSLVSPNTLYLGSKDLNSVTLINSLIEIGVNSLKIEGRMKSIHYIATVVRNYRKIIDGNISIEDALEDLKYVESRDTTLGFLQNEVTKKDIIYEVNDSSVNQNFLGYVLSQQGNMLKVQAKNNFKDTDKIQIIGFDKEVSIHDYKLFDDKKVHITTNTHPDGIVYIQVNNIKTKKYYIIRKID
jgi:putative protease